MLLKCNAVTEITLQQHFSCYI